MNYIEAVILGAVQGISEFLPISSTAHIILVEKVLGLSFPGLTLEVFLHLASILAVIYYFFKTFIQLGDKMFRTGFFLIISTLVTGVLGLLMENILGDLLKGTYLIAGGLFFSGILLYLVEKNISVTGGRKLKKKLTGIGLYDSVIIGIWQGLAVIPGISRAGATVAGALLNDFDKESALSYSFYLSVPVIISSSIIKIPDMEAHLFNDYPGEMVVAFIVSFFFALVGIKTLIYLVKQTKLTYFSLYLVLISVLLLLVGELGE